MVLLIVFYISLKTGIEWYLLPILQLLSKEVLHYKKSLDIIVNGVKQEDEKPVGVVLYKRTNQKLIYPVEM